jgi:hypothetical protein
MAVKITEIFGFQVNDQSEIARAQRQSEMCPFIGGKCWKYFRSGGLRHGTCTLKAPDGPEVVVCPDRLYAESFKILKDVAHVAFGPDISIVRPSDLPATQGQQNRVVAFGKRLGKELRVQKAAGSSDDYSSDWMLALLNEDGVVQSFVPVEVQTMDTTGSYQREWYEIYDLDLPANCEPTPPGFNWENVNKRIIAQLLIKGNTFSREEKCNKGLFFICPEPVYQSLVNRLGAKLSPFPLVSGALTFRRYELAPNAPEGESRKLIFTDQMTTSVQNFRDAYNSTLNLPAMGVIEQTINLAIQKILTPKKKRKKSD